MTQQVALICTTEKIDGYTDNVAKTDLYAVNISTALMTTGTMAIAGVEDMLRPWLWKSLDGGPFQVTVFLQTDPRDITKGNKITTTCVAPPPLSAPAQKAVTDSLTAQLETAFNIDPNLIAFNNADPGHLPTSPNPAIQPWPHLLAHASTFPAPVPQALNLVLFFRIPTVAANVAAVYAAPNFLANGVSCNASLSQPAAPTVAATGAISPVPSWAYKIDSTLPQVTVYQPGFDPQTPAPAVWLTGTPEDGANQDWRANLDQTLPDAFDLGQRSIDALRALTQAQIAAIFNLAPDETQPTDPVILDDLRMAILSAFRDTADFGLRYAPDGLNLLQFVLRGSGQADTQIAPILAALNAADATFNFGTWQNNLQTLFPGLMLLQQVSQWPVNQTNLDTLIAQLDSLQTKLADDATLAQCLYQNWNTTLSASAVATAWNAMSLAVQTQLTSLSTSHTLRKRMLQANIGGTYVTGAAPDFPMWTLITKIANDNGITDADQLKANLTSLLPAFFASRFNQNVGSTINAGRQPGILSVQPGFANWQQLLAAMNASIAAQAGDFAQNLFPGDPKPTTVPQPLIVKVLGTGQTGDQDNPLRSLSGIGILLKEDGATDWSALNIATLSVNTTQTNVPSQTDPPAPTYVQAASNIFAPYRISLRNGILQTAISYDNNPLIAQSPLTPMSSQVVAGNDQGTRTNPLFQFTYAPDPTNLLDPTKLDAWAHIYGLKFGRKYDFLIFRMTNSGALPAALTDGKLPWNLQPPASFQQGQLPVTSAGYYRRVPISHPRLPFDPSAVNNGTLPAIPASVFPLARSLPNPGTTIDANGNAVPLPLLLLWRASGADTGKNAAYTFPVRAPQINLQTWDRWVAAYSDPSPAPAPAPGPPPTAYRNTRAALYADFVTSAKKSTSDAVPVNAQTVLASTPDISIDDPAVSYLEFKLTVITTSAKTVPLDELDQFVFFPGPKSIGPAFTYRDGFNQVQSSPYQVSISIDTAVTMKIDSVLRTVTITILEGDVWKLTINPIVTKESFARFEPFTGTDNQFSGLVPVKDPSGNPISAYRSQTSARELLIEAAAPLPQADGAAVLWSSLSLDFGKMRLLVANLDPKVFARPDLFYKADITHQVWRWMGRPFPSGALPDKTPLDGTFPKILGSAPDLNVDPIILQDALYWEAQAFAERSLTDTHTVSSNVNYPLILISTIDDQGNVTTIKTVPQPVSLTKYDLSKDPRANYYLFSVTLHSRYEGLPAFYTPNGTTTQKVTSRNSLTGGSTPWKRIFLPAVATSTAPPKPKILICLPLAEPLDPAVSTTTGFLVVADEPWPQIAGLAEELIATIQYARDPKAPLDDPNPAMRPEIGLDPILLSTPYSLPASPAFKSPGKPIGTTFDDLSSAPLFANTCFHFPVPDGLNIADWHMAKITFTRSLRPDLTTNGTTVGIALQSAPSDPVWVQFLPSSYHFCYAKAATLQTPESDPVNVTQLTFQVAASGTGIQFLLNGGNITIVPGPAGLIDTGKQVLAPLQLEIWALVMQKITDAAGKPAESYRGIYRASKDGAFQPIDNAGLGNVPNGYVPQPGDAIYLLEVQKDTRNIDIDPAGVPAALFAPTLPANPDKEITHRIVRFSPRIANPAT